MEKFVTYGGEVDSPSPINFPERVCQIMRESGTNHTIGLKTFDEIPVDPSTKEIVIKEIAQLAEGPEPVSDPSDPESDYSAVLMVLFAFALAIGLELTKTKIPWYLLFQLSN